MKRKKALEAPQNTAVIYARYSSHNQREESIDAQVRACEEYAAKHGLQVVQVYQDSAKSGTNADREQFQRMIEDSGKGLFRVLLIHKLDRFSRDKYDAVTYKRKLAFNRVSLISVSENLDGSPESKILESLLEGMAQYYSENLSREVMKGMKESAYKGTHLGGTPPLGYGVDPDTRRYVVNEAEAAIVHKIFEMYADGAGYKQILSSLNGMGYQTKQGRPFGSNSLYSILRNEKYTGRFIFNKRREKDVSGRRNPCMNPESEWIVLEGGIPAIIDQELFDKVQLKLERNAGTGGRFKAKEYYLLSGLVFCGECGASMFGNTRPCGRKKTRYSSYRCSNRREHRGCDNKELRREYLENYVLDALYKALFSEASIKQLARMLSDYNLAKAKESNKEMQLAGKELVEIEGKIERIVRLVAESDIAPETVSREIRRLEERKHWLEAYVHETTLQDSALLISEEEIVRLIEKSGEFVRTRNIPECRSFIDSYIEKVLVYRDHVEVRFKVYVPEGESGGIAPLKSEERIEVIQVHRGGGAQPAS